jgi:diguanylate cyclase (GGDEF)-like protein
VWAALVTQNGAGGLSRAGVQTSGHLRAVQSLSLIDTQTDALETKRDTAGVAKLRDAQRVLDDSLHRMSHGDVPEASRIADEAAPIVQRMRPAINRFLARPPGYDSNGNTGAEEAMEQIIAELQILLNDLEADPSRLLAAKLASVSAHERTVRATAFILIPLGLGGVAACGWLLGVYRRRADAVMRASLDESAQEARTDELTSLPNRRAMIEELERRTHDGERFTLVLADLNGFKRYNDTFGHPAGDALLRRLGRQLAAACEGCGIPARLGGDEFCVLLFGDVPADDAHARVRAALSDEGVGFRITAATGVTAVPDEGRDASAALRLADSRMYAAKVSAHPSAEEDMSGALMRMLDARHPGLGSHVEEVALLAGACAEELGLPVDDVRAVERAAELHDLGKVAIPSAILTKRGSLDDDEWEFMSRHSIIGERILAGVPSLQHVSSLVRASHERWDGHGYPDALAGEETPIGARIVFVADAYCAMTEDRPYAEARSEESTRAELLACAGAQFDPAVVTAFLAALDDRRSHVLAAASPAQALT